ncbi:hypothetical protein COO60DRAFT_1548527 [Scenedesmus sp. NREL 46B-D3]|nr:hypothetical protein COO60DRAFT_1548527 [Scenedesmus sp. NREL 46B-D3]
MAGLGALLGGYGSEDDELDEQQQGSPSGALPLLGMLGGAASASPSKADQLTAAVDAAGGTPQQQQQQQQGADSDGDHPAPPLPLRVMDGPSTNPEPPLEGLSPPHGEAGLAGAAGTDVAPDVTAAAGGVGLAEDGTAADAEADAAAVDPARLILPPELREAPPGQPSESMQARVESIYRTQVQTGKSLVSVLRKNRRWQNPDFLEKMVRYYHLDQYGSSLSVDVFDPKGIPDEDKWPALAAVLQQRKRMRGAEVQFRSSGQQQQSSAGAAGGAAGGLSAAAAAAAAAGSGGGAAAGSGSGLPAAPKMLPPDPRKVEAAQAQAQALANALLSGATKKSKWDK